MTDTAEHATGNIERIPVDLGARSYDIVVGSGLLENAAAHLAPGALRARPAPVRRLIIVTDETVAGRHLPRLTHGLRRAGLAHDVVILPPGEQSKSFAELERLLDRLLALNVERGDVLAALGGGVVGDLAGFAAACVLRGIGFVQAPTTLMAQVDSSIGGKTGINTSRGKNLVGALHQPLLVLADTGTLETLPLRALRSGYAEVMKHGLMRDAAFFGWLEQEGLRALAGGSAALRHAVISSCRIKAGIVAADETEKGARMLLNLGHTFAHALEAATGYSDRLTHGEAVGAGLALAFDLSVELGHCPAADGARVRRHLRACGMPAGLGDVPGGAPEADLLMQHMRRDKKTSGGRQTFILAQGIGRVFAARNVDAGRVHAFLRAQGAP